MVTDALKRGATWAVLLACGAAAATPTMPESVAAAPIVGEPLQPRPDDSVRPTEGTYVVDDLRVADPDGGLPWAFATFIARPATAPGEAVCVEVGRALESRLGIVEAGGGVFRPFVPTRAPAVQCGLLGEAQGARAFGFSSLVVPAQVSRCGPEASAAAVCGRNPRTVMVGAFGKGILGAWMRDRDRADQLAFSKTGMFLAVFSGRFTEATFPTVSVQATVCGPDARRDLLQTWRATRRGCLLTFDVPTGPRPQRESAASKRARTLPALDRPVRVIEDRGAAPNLRFSARVIVPITVRSNAEGYAYRLAGPTGARCERRHVTDTSRSYQSSYLMAEGKPLRLHIAPPRRAGAWCRGTYRFTLLHVQVRAAKRRLAFATRPIGSASFRVR